MNTTYDQVHFLVVVDLLHLLILACMRASHDISSGILILMLSCKLRSKDDASQPQQESALDHKWYLFHMGEE